MNYAGVIFDLDGTLVNTLDDLADSCNRQLERYGYPTHPTDAYRYFVGNGAKKLVERALPAESAASLIDEFLADFKAEYAHHCFDKTAPYSGVPELLERLKEEGVPMAVLSNKPDAETRRVVERYFPSGLFAAVAGQRDAIPHKPDPAGVEPILEALKLEASATAFVGDTWIDMETAKRSACVPIGVLWGFRERAELVEHEAGHLARTPEELASLLLG